MPSARRAAALLVLLNLGPARGCSRTSPAPPGVVVEEGLAGSAAGAGLRPGDVLTEWSRGGGGAGDQAVGGRLDSPFALDELEREQAPRGELELRGSRGAGPLTVRLSRDAWRLRARPRFSVPDTVLYERGRRHVREGNPVEGAALWSGLARRLSGAGDFPRAAWLHLEAARAAADGKDPGRADAAAAAARAAARACGEPGVVASSEEAIARLLEGRSDWDGAARALQAAADAQRTGSPGGLREAWRLYRLGEVARRRGDGAAAAQHYRRALEIVEALAPDSLLKAESLNGLGTVAYARGDLKLAGDSHRQALHVGEKIAPQGLEVAASLGGLGLVARAKGDLAAAEDYFRRCLAIHRRLAPAGGDVAAAFRNLGALAYSRGDLAVAESCFRRALDLLAALGTNAVEVAGGLNNLGAVLADRGDFVEAESCFRRALAISEDLAPGSLQVASVLGNLGVVTKERGSLTTAESYYRRALALQERLVPGTAAAARTLNNLGDLAFKRRDLGAAEDFFRRSLAIKEAQAPHGPEVVPGLANLGITFLERRDLGEARRLLLRALAVQGRLGRRSLWTSSIVYSLGEIDRIRGDRVSAEKRHRQALALRRALAPGSAKEAESLGKLAALCRLQGRRAEAAALYRRALEALEAQRSTLAGLDEARSTFALGYGSVYQEAIDLLVERGNTREAFHVLERYRARGLLALLAERDLVFSADIPEELDRERRMANVAYDRLQSDLLRDEPAKAAAKQAALRLAREQQAAIRDRIRAASPRLAALHYPEPFDLDGAHRALDPGTLLLSYCIGDAASVLFAVGPRPGDFAALRLDTDRVRLGRDVQRFREGLRDGAAAAELRAEAERLGAVLLGPVAELLSRAERLMIAPDGALHLVPFAALVPPARGRERRYLIEDKPIHVAASATVFGELKKRRRAARPPRLVAFGDPDYSALLRAAGADGAPADRSGTPSALQGRLALLRGLDLRPLPSARREIQALARIFAGAAQAYVGRAATEERAKAVGEAATHVHFACHGLANEGAPLDSTLALAIPGDWRPGLENGLLQAWEVLEQVRIDADLVTLSACNTALGQELSGEGILGLTRAFQYAGARSLLASLWEVNDLSTAELMARFYAHLKDGRSKDAALREAQIEMIHRVSSAHPSRWAAFQLIGDWQ